MNLEEKIQSLGFVDWAYTEKLEALSFNHYDKFLKQYPQKLQYLKDERALKRKSLKNIYPEAQSALVFLWDYKKEKKTLKNFKKIAAYVFAFEQDYHYSLKEKLDEIGKTLDCDYKICVDTESVLEKDLAVRAGLGWIGKNSLLLNKKIGSYTLIGSIILNKKLILSEKSQEQDHCGQCRRCIEACPTGAIHEERSLKINDCLSTFTIETFKEENPPENFLSSEKYFGCDICQEVCPWNQKPLQRAEEIVFGSKRQEYLNFFQEEPSKIYQKLEKFSKKDYKNFFEKSPFVRLGKRGLIKNLKPFLKDPLSK